MSKEKNDASLVLSFVENKETFELWSYGKTECKEYTLYVLDDPDSYDMPWVVKKYAHEPTREQMLHDAQAYQKGNMKK